MNKTQSKKEDKKVEKNEPEDSGLAFTLVSLNLWLFRSFDFLLLNFKLDIAWVPLGVKKYLCFSAKNSNGVCFGAPLNKVYYYYNLRNLVTDDYIALATVVCYVYFECMAKFWHKLYFGEQNILLIVMYCLDGHCHKYCLISLKKSSKSP